MVVEDDKHDERIAFGPFCLSPRERLLIRDGEPVQIGGRSFDLLVALTERPGQVLTKRELLKRVWSNVVVEDSSLRFHMAGLRKLLGDGEDGARYIATQVGVGYAFVAPIERLAPGDAARFLPAADPAVAETDTGPAARPPRRLRLVGREPDPAPGEARALLQANLPGSLQRMVGRAEDIRALSKQLERMRFVTIAGAGGVGKTTVALAVGHDLVEDFAGIVYFVDLGAVGDPGLVAATTASTLGLSVQSDDPAAGLVAYLAQKRALLILDTCEHVIDAVADLASRIFAAAPQVHILATSREPLRAEGEHVHKLASLACPPDDPGLAAADARAFPAIQLFLERAAAGGAVLDLDDADTAVVARICRKLAGVPLAIELVAGRVGGHGLRQTAELLDQRLTLLWPGLRTAPPRQQTLQATLDWSYGLLSALERTVLARLAVFVGDFTIGAALEVVACAAIDRARIFSAIDGLVAKSMVAARQDGAMMRYRLLDTTRAYALQAAAGDAALEGLAAQHAAYHLGWLEDVGTHWPELSSTAQRSRHLAALANVRAALEWAFGPDGDIRTGVRLAVAAAPVFLAMSSLPECLRWSERAISVLDEAGRGGRDEMHLQSAMGVSLMFMHGGRDAARVALERSLAIAEASGDALDQLRLLGPLNMFHRRTGEFADALRYAERFSAAAGIVGDPGAIALARSILGVSLHLRGDLADAQAELESALAGGPRSQRESTVHLGFDGGVLARGILARNQWLLGHPRQAAALSRQAVEQGAAMDHSLTLSIALIWAISVCLWSDDVDGAAEHVEVLKQVAGAHSFAPFLLLAQGFGSEVAIRRGDAAGGVEGLRDALSRLHAAPYELLTTELNIALARGLAEAGRDDQALQLVDGALGRVEAGGNLLYLPELLRIRAALLLRSPEPAHGDAEACLRKSLELCRGQGARAWELRSATDLAALLAARGERDGARAVLQPVFEGFTEGLESTDMRAAARVLAGLG